MNAQLNPKNTHASIRLVYLDSMATIFNSGNQVCPVITMMPEYKIKKRDGSVWLSKSFYTHDNGYKMCLFVYAAGEDHEGTHLSVTVKITLSVTVKIT